MPHKKLSQGVKSGYRAGYGMDQPLRIKWLEVIVGDIHTLKSNSVEVHDTVEKSLSQNCSEI